MDSPLGESSPQAQLHNEVKWSQQELSQKPADAYQDMKLHHVCSALQMQIQSNNAFVLALCLGCCRSMAGEEFQRHRPQRHGLHVNTERLLTYVNQIQGH